MFVTLNQWMRISVFIHLAPPWKWILTLPIELEQPAAAMVGWPVLSTPNTNTIKWWKIMKKWIPKTFASSESLGCLIFLYHSALWRNREIKTGIFFKVHLRCNGWLNHCLILIQVLKKNCRTRIPNWLLLTSIKFVYFWGKYPSKSALTDCARKSGLVYYKKCSYISKIMPIIMLVVVNYDPFIKKWKKKLLLFTLNLVQ